MRRIGDASQTPRRAGRAGRPYGLPARPRGLALITVLWVMVLLSLIAASFARTSRTEVNLARNLIDNAEAEALAEAGVYRAILGLIEADPARPWRVDGTAYAWSYGGAEVRLAVQDEGGKLDLNAAPQRLLVGLLRSAGLAEPEAAAMADRIADFRDGDDLTRVNGAEDPDYAEAGLAWGAKDAPFEAVAELQQVLGVSPELYARLAPALTLYAGRNPPFEPVAPPEVRAFYGVFEVLREQAGEAPGEEAALGEGPEPEAGEAPAPLAPAVAPGMAAARSRVPVYTIRAEARLAGGAVFAREAIVRLGREGRAPYRVLAWRQGPRRLFAGEGAQADPADGGGG